MSKIVTRSFSAKVPSDTDFRGFNFYFDNTADADFIAKASVGMWPVSFTRFAAWDGVAERITYVLPAGDLPDGIYDVSVASVDATGNLSNAVTKAEFNDLPLDVTVPGVPTDLATESF